MTLSIEIKDGFMPFLKVLMKNEQIYVRFKGCSEHVLSLTSRAVGSMGHPVIIKFTYNGLVDYLADYYTIFARGVMVIVVGNGHADSSSDPGQE